MEQPPCPLTTNLTAPVARTADTGSATASGTGDTTRTTDRRDSVPGQPITCDICVIGAGSGGLSVAVAAAAFGRKVVLLEKHKMGGDCLNFGCVPSKALIAAGKRAQAMRTSAPFGVAPAEPEIDFARVNDHVRNVIAAIAPNDSVERFNGLGVTVIQEAGRFVDKDTVAAGAQRIKARRFVIATGSAAVRAADPRARYRALFHQRDAVRQSRKARTPDRRRRRTDRHGDGPGAPPPRRPRHRARRHDRARQGRSRADGGRPEASARAKASISARAPRSSASTAAPATSASPSASADGSDTVTGTHLLIAVGRRANMSTASASRKPASRPTRTGIKVDAGMVTTNRKVFAIGDVAGGLQFTHVANYHAGIVIRKALVPPARQGRHLDHPLGHLHRAGDSPMSA